MIELKIVLNPHNWQQTFCLDLYNMDGTWLRPHAENIAGYAWEIAPWEHGDLAGTIGVQDIKDGNEIIGYHIIAGTYDHGYVPSALGRDVDYAPYLEYENPRHANGPYPFMGPAFDREEDDIIATAMKLPDVDTRAHWTTRIRRI